MLAAFGNGGVVLEGCVPTWRTAAEDLSPTVLLCPCFKPFELVTASALGTGSILMGSYKDTFGGLIKQGPHLGFLLSQKNGLKAILGIVFGTEYLNLWGTGRSRDDSQPLSRYLDEGGLRGRVEEAQRAQDYP